MLIPIIDRLLTTFIFVLLTLISFPKAVFLRDMNLIQAYSSTWGNSKASIEEGLVRYFGEYLSQGVLKVEGECQIFSA